MVHAVFLTLPKFHSVYSDLSAAKADRYFTDLISSSIVIAEEVMGNETRGSGHEPGMGNNFER